MFEKFSLKWTNFQKNAVKSFQNLSLQQHFCDVTLVSDDQKQFSAHKVVLSACSEYFQNILTLNTHSHPLLCLSEVSSKDLNNMLDFIYFGEVQVYQDDIDRFLHVAQRFHLKGLLQQEQDEIEVVQIKKECQEDLEDGMKITDTKISNIGTESDSIQAGPHLIPRY